MRLTKLEIYGFKSFAKRTEIIFPQNVTGIVGPNGSGKSNIGDAVRWVLGEQSARTLRGNSMSDVIFNGTEKRKPMNYCEVSLIFDNTDRQLKVEYDEVSITRRVYRSGESEYLMNGTSCRLKDIIDMFRDTGIGKEGYSMIGQGRIDEILSQKSEDRRAVFEEAVGISRFRNRKEEAENRLKKADENILRVLDILEELESHLKPLEKQAETAKEYIRLSDKLKEYEIRLYLIKIDRLQEKEAAFQQILLDISDLVSSSKESLEAALLKRTAEEQVEEDLQKQLAQAHTNQLDRNELLHQAKEHFNEVINQIIQNDETLQRYKSETENLIERKKLITTTIEHGENGRREAETVFQQAQADEKEAEESAAQAELDAERIEQELNSKKDAVLEQMSLLQDVKSALARQMTMQTQLERRRYELLENAEAEKKNHAECGERLQRSKCQLETEEVRLSDLKNQAEVHEAETNALLKEILEQQNVLQDELQKEKVIDTRLKTIRELQDGYEGYQYAVRNALLYAKHNHIAGVHDVIAMLIHVPKEYETALDMSLGQGMQNIVTDTEQEAKKLIEYLRSNRLGRATFLPISTVKGKTLNSQERKVLSMPGCIGVASELCTYDEKYRDVIESLLGRTVIATDLDCGINIMKAGGHSFRLVTLQGDVMHSGGSMTGGSIQQKAQNLLGRERELSELSEQLKKIRNHAADLQEKLISLENCRKNKKELRNQILDAVHQQEIAVARDTERRNQAQSALDESEKRMHEYSDGLEQLNDALEQVVQELERLNHRQQAAETTPDELNTDIERLSRELEIAKKARDAARDRHTGCKLTLQSAQHDLDMISRDRERLLKDLRTCESDVFNLEKQIAELEKFGIESNSQREKLSLQVSECEKEATAAKQFVELSQSKLDEQHQSLKTLQADIDTLQIEYTRETEHLHKQEALHAKITDDIAQLNEKIWNNYEIGYEGAKELVRFYDDKSSENDASFKETAAETECRQIRERIRGMGSVNVGAVEEYEQQLERYRQMTEQKADLERAKADLQDLIKQLLGQMKTVFVEQFSQLQKYFSETFTRLFGGGSGEIRLADPDDPLNCGIDIIVQPPGKKRQILSLFSGGERALTAIAILFAMLKLKPTPFCILDEIEAALDDANISYFADYLKEFSEGTQFIVVTHRKGTMERCDSLFGVAMEEKGVSSMVSVNLQDYVEEGA